MSISSDLRVLWHMLFTPIKGATHADRLKSFYEGQAADYDGFRERLLKGRRELLASLAPAEGSVWVDLGGGTGANLDAAPWLSKCRKVYVVDLCEPLLEECRRRIEARGWTNVETVVADATTFQPPEPVDLLTCSYSLTMIPDWFAAIDQAKTILRDGGTIGVVDFHVSRKYVPEGRTRHSWLTRSLIPIWFSTDNVHPSPDHISYLTRHFERVSLDEGMAKLPYVPFLRAPYYRFVGRKTSR